MSAKRKQSGERSNYNFVGGINGINKAQEKETVRGRRKEKNHRGGQTGRGEFGSKQSDATKAQVRKGTTTP